MAPMVDRLRGYLAVCDPPEQRVNELAAALLASRRAIADSVNTLEIRATRPSGCVVYTHRWPRRRLIVIRPTAHVMIGLVQRLGDEFANVSLASGVENTATIASRAHKPRKSQLREMLARGRRCNPHNGCNARNIEFLLRRSPEKP